MNPNPRPRSPLPSVAATTAAIALMRSTSGLGIKAGKQPHLLQSTWLIKNEPLKRRTALQWKSLGAFSNAPKLNIDHFHLTENDVDKKKVY